MRIYVLKGGTPTHVATSVAELLWKIGAPPTALNRAGAMAALRHARRRGYRIIKVEV